ncbi:hypothetical protein FUA23_04695 [Neolewinella aurantiaca]|uniref:Uncharacterized protein n=1 Tax=Neolewinella aurantiaca TaxID=2602767 RepID=A0A5C7FWG3_9BACT|nr:hypothetical protein [Neolewinella aurantiaca]TXF90742.1 hypothetical protein FUA23_04695 [Neolewinella aurantiaca]
MQKIETFSPQLGDIHGMLAICGAIFVLLVWLAFRLNKIKDPDPRKRVLLPMLAYFMALLALMGFLGSFWTLFKYPTLEISDTEMIINGESNRLPSASNVRLENYESGGLGPSSRVLLVQTKDRKTWAFPEDRYPVNEIMRLLRKE